MTTAQRTVISNPATGLLVYDTDFNNFWFYYGTAWVQAIGIQGPQGTPGTPGSASLAYSAETCLTQSWSGCNTQNVALGSTTNRVCFLTRAAGKWEGGGEGTRVFGSGGQWYLEISSCQTAVTGCTRCISW